MPEFTGTITGIPTELARLRGELAAMQHQRDEWKDMFCEASNKWAALREAAELVVVAWQTDSADTEDLIEEMGVLLTLGQQPHTDEPCEGRIPDGDFSREHIEQTERDAGLDPRGP